MNIRDVSKLTTFYVEAEVNGELKEYRKFLNDWEELRYQSVWDRVEPVEEEALDYYFQKYLDDNGIEE